MAARLTFLAVLIGIVLGAFWLIGALATGSTNSRVDQPPPPSERVTLTAQDGIHLVGSYWPGASDHAPGVLLVHGNGASRGQMFSTAQWLHSLGYATLAIDLRGHGESDAAPKSFGVSEAIDAAAGVEWLRERQRGAQVGAIGFSLGGAALLIGKDGPVPVDALVVQAVYPDIRSAIFNRFALVLGRWPTKIVEPMLSYQSYFRYGVSPAQMSPLTAIRANRAPVFVIGGEQDVFTPVSETRAIFDAAGGDRTYWIVPGAQHDTMGFADDPAWRERVGAFLQSHLPNRETESHP